MPEHEEHFSINGVLLEFGSHLSWQKFVPVTYLAVSGTKVTHDNMYWLMGRQFIKENKYTNKYWISLGNQPNSYLNEIVLFVYYINMATKDDT